MLQRRRHSRASRAALTRAARATALSAALAPNINVRPPATGSDALDAAASRTRFAGARSASRMVDAARARASLTARV